MGQLTGNRFDRNSIGRPNMNRKTLVFAMSLSVLVAGRANAEDLFRFRFVETKESQVRIIDVDPKGLAGQMGLRQDDILVSINRMEIRSKANLESALKNVVDTKQYTIVVKRPPDPAAKSASDQRKPLTGQLIRSSTGAYYVR